ncbi:spondin domain-containing protein [Paraferrimonas haliotis]|uniref:Spondin domain-containing protein n=1 Tax=Paraferrimonas haliotis TaxID=2013866 RepID=A0AA37TMR6_9GAMM|nr:spondin domain-containing protein [Paraferrimonas haliotis]GLS84494.1 hypothetical protein GCM10007894_24710 [Paraferrimonas haliotis]
MTILTSTNKRLLAIALMTAALTACGDDDDDNGDDPVVMPPPAMTQTYQITLVNLTANQPMSPATVVSHPDSIALWTTGEMASETLEMMAEGGDGSGFAELEQVLASTSADGMLMPGDSQNIEFELTAEQVDQLSFTTMLVNTNDAFTGLNGFDFSALAVDEQQAFMLNAYDAGTEANSEVKGSIPGPADGGEGFNAERDDVDRVFLHSGVISQADGLMDSVLMPSHRFDNPVLAVHITRTK